MHGKHVQNKKTEQEDKREGIPCSCGRQELPSSISVRGRGLLYHVDYLSVHMVYCSYDDVGPERYC